MRKIFSGSAIELQTFLANQREFLVGQEIEEFAYLPKIIAKSFTRIYEILKSDPSVSNFKRLTLPTVNDSAFFETSLEDHKDKINLLDWSSLQNEDNLSLVVELLYEWLEINVDTIVQISTIEMLLSDDEFLSLVKTKSDNIEKNKLHVLTEIVECSFNLAEKEFLLYYNSFIDSLLPISGSEHYVEKFKRRFVSHMLGLTYEEFNRLENESPKDLTELVNSIDLVSILMAVS